MRCCFILFLLALVALGKEPPTSKRAQTAIEAVRPQLTTALKAEGAEWGVPIFIRIFKDEKKLELWIKGADQYALFKTYDVCYFSGELGPKLKEGDMQSPEGFYGVTSKLMNPWSSFHLSFNVGYPNKYDRSLGRTGSYIMIHGDCVSTGCYAMKDEKIEEIYAMVDAALRHGQSTVPVHIFPFKMSEGKMNRLGEGKWRDFWVNLKEGYDYFEKHNKPPVVKTSRGRYTFQ